jgi:hypothetical protein
MDHSTPKFSSRRARRSTYWQHRRKVGGPANARGACTAEVGDSNRFTNHTRDSAHFPEWMVSATSRGVIGLSFDESQVPVRTRF